jgi:hypothetical protein
MEATQELAKTQAKNSTVAIASYSLLIAKFIYFMFTHEIISL